ncbi:Bax inhibitor 1-related [Cinara cedri]|uniref:Bax inhibitor 1-related n=1 Tax=Cinara cedri TaxID=506608 RepID=A0A5E4M488_9HEMI|nr:Bax inhibitor 1-related [Cinara cedri]
MSTATFRSFARSFGSKIEKPVRTHLVNVYACLTLSMIAAAIGAYVHVYTNFLSAGILTALGGTGLLLALMYTQDNGKNHTLRISYLVGFAFFTGLGIGPLMEYVIHVDPSIIPTTFLATTFIFTSFSLSAIFAERGKWLYLGGILMSLLSVLVLMSFANLFLGSELIFKGYLYIGLCLMSGFVLYDTQLIMEKRRAGDKDFIAHSVDLFVDFIGIFRRLLIILSQKEQGSKKRKD